MFPANRTISTILKPFPKKPCDRLAPLLTREGLGEVSITTDYPSQSPLINGGSKRKTFLNTAIVCVLLIIPAGCLTRTEKITVARDGRMSFQLTYEGDVEEFAQGDAMPSDLTGWHVERKSKLNDEGKEQVILTATQDFAPAQELPRSYASSDDTDADLFLDFPTSLEIQHERDGSYYHFKRDYTPRPWAYIEHWHNTFLDDNIKKISDKPIEQLTQSDRLQMVQAFIGLEAFKQIEFAKRALGECEPDLPGVQWLLTRQALLDAYRSDHLIGNADESDPLPVKEAQRVHNYVDQLFTRCVSLSQDEQNACFDQEAQQIKQKGYHALIDSLRNQAGLIQHQIDAFERSYQRAQKYRSVTERLGGHSFEVCVNMPGTIVAHNADKSDGHGEVCWEFKGKAFRDRPVVLLAVSRVGLDTKQSDQDR